MKKLISLLICICMVFANLSVAGAYDVNDIVCVNMGFESVMTNSSPSGVSLTNTYGYVREDIPGKNKILEIAKTAKAGEVGFSFGNSSDSMNFSFEITLKDTHVSRSFGIKDTSSVFAAVATIGTDGFLTTNDGKKLTRLLCDKKYKISFICRMGNKRAELYLDGKCIASNILLGNASGLKGISALSFSTDTGGFGSVFCLDNVRCVKGDKFPGDSYFEPEEYNYGFEEYVSGVDENNQDTQSVYVNLDFNNDTTGKKPASGSGETKEDGNVFMVQDIPDEKDKSFMFSKKAGSDPLYNFTVSDFKALYAVLSLSFMSTDTISSKVITMRDVNAQFNEVFRVAPAGDIKVAGKVAGSYKAGEWYDVTLIMSYRDFTIDAYINGECTVQAIPFSNAKADSPSTMRLTIPSASEPGTIYVDNLRFYAGKEIKTPEQLSGNTTGGKKQLITPENEVCELLENAVAIQLYGNKAYSSNGKTVLSKGGVINSGNAFVPVRYTTESFGGSVEWNSLTNGISLNLDGKTAELVPGSAVAKINGTNVNLSSAVYVENGTALVPATDFAQKFLNCKLSCDDKYGIAVLDRSKKELTSSNIKDIYDFITYTRPDSEQIIADFQKNKNVHPRIILNPATFNRAAAAVKENETIKSWYDVVVKKCDETITQKHTYYYIPDGTRLLDMSRQLLSRSLNLSFTYLISGEEKYKDYLWGEIEAVCSFTDWNSHRHFLDTAEMMTGVAIAYDWLYDSWTESQRNLMEEAILNMGLKQGEMFYKWEMPSGTQWQTITNNWGVVCNGGMTVGALALMDKYPDYCADIISTAFLSLENSLGEFSPDGAWVEGPDYWTYTNQYLGYYMSSLISTLGTDYGYLNTNNISRTGEYATYTQSHQGSFNVGDAGAGKVGSPAVFFYADYFGNPSLAKLRLLDMENYKTTPSITDIIYINPDMLRSDVALSLDYMMRDVEMATFRSAWGDSTAIFAGIKGGYNDATHGNLDAGTFVLDALGVRWADELGSDNYNQSNYFTKTNAARYYLYYCSTQGQNVLAINPVSELGQQQYSTSKITEFVSKPKGGYSVIDMTSAYGNKVTSAKRGLMLDHNRTQVVVQDELNLKNATDIWWFMQTKASVELLRNGKAALHTKNGRTMYVGIDSNVKGARFTVSSSSPLAGSPIKAGVNSTSSFRRLNINLPKAKGEVKLAVRFVPITGDMMYNDILLNGTSKMLPIDMWNIEDGEIELPALENITIDGTPLAEFSSDKTAYNIDLEFGKETAPVVEAFHSDEYTAQIVQPVDANGTAEIKLYEKTDETNANYYTLSFKVQPYFGQPADYNRFTVKNVTVSSEPQEENPRAHAIDGDINTRWSAEGENEWIKLDLGSTQNISTITLSFYQGTKRVTYFDIEVSQDGTNYTKVFSGESSGLTDGYETYFIGNRKARYIRFACRGNSSNKWNSINEIEIYGK